MVYNGANSHTFDYEVDPGSVKHRYAIGPLDPDWTGLSHTLAFQLHGLHRQPDFCVLFNAYWEW